MRETMPNRMLIIETLPRASSTDFTKRPFVRKPTLVRDPKNNSQRARNSPRLSQPAQIPLVELPNPSGKKHPLKITTRVAPDNSKFSYSGSGDNRPLKITPLERSTNVRPFYYRAQLLFNYTRVPRPLFD